MEFTSRKGRRDVKGTEQRQIAIDWLSRQHHENVETEVFEGIRLKIEIIKR